jgi:hypothetical protein
MAFKLLLAGLAGSAALYFVDHRAAALGILLTLLLFFVGGVFSSTRENTRR